MNATTTLYRLRISNRDGSHFSSTIYSDLTEAVKACRRASGYRDSDCAAEVVEISDESATAGERVAEFADGRDVYDGRRITLRIV